LDEMKYFSFDLSRSAEARVKVYVHHHHCTTEDLEGAAGAASFYRPGEVSNFTAIIAPGCEAGFHRRSPLTCYAFRKRLDQTLITASTHLPVNSYAPDDQTIGRRVRSCLAQLGLEQETYSRSLLAYANRSLEDSIGTHSYVSLVSGPDPRLTVYLAAEAYRAGTVADPRAQTPVPSWQKQITNHPFLRRLRREPVNLRHLWRLLANFQISISKNFARWLAELVAKVEDDRIRCILADQLNDELGQGRFERAHVNLFAQMMDVLAPFGAPSETNGSVLKPGRKLEVQ